MSWEDSTDFEDQRHIGAVDQLLIDLGRVLAEPDDPRTVFSEFSRLLEGVFDIRKGFLALREGDQTRFLAVATWKKDRIRKNLSLRLPSASSLFEKVAETGQIYSENFADLFDGNFLERRLLLDDNTASFMLRPLKHEARVVGLIGWSSDVPDAFVTIQEGLLDAAFDQLGAFLGQLQLDRVGI